MFVIILLLSLPLVVTAIVPLMFDVTFTSFITQFGQWWLFLSVFWGALIAVISYVRGRTIEVLETAKFAVETINDNKHHINSAYSFLKGKVRKQCQE